MKNREMGYMAYLAKKMREDTTKMMERIKTSQIRKGFSFSPDRGRTIYLFIYYLN